MRWIVSYEHRRADVITKILKDSDASKQNSHLGFLRILRIQKKKIQECMRQGKRNYSTI